MVALIGMGLLSQSHALHSAEAVKATPALRPCPWKSGATPALALSAAAKIEQKGIPTVVLTRSDFVGVVRNPVAGLGFAPDIPMQESLVQLAMLVEPDIPR